MTSRGCCHSIPIGESLARSGERALFLLALICIKKYDYFRHLQVFGPYRDFIRWFVEPASHQHGGRPYAQAPQATFRSNHGGRSCIDVWICGLQEQQPRTKHRAESESGANRSVAKRAGYRQPASYRQSGCGPATELFAGGASATTSSSAAASSRGTAAAGCRSRAASSRATA